MAGMKITPAIRRDRAELEAELEQRLARDRQLIADLETRVQALEQHMSSVDALLIRMGQQP